jgi:histidinol phosphatase-like enzyme
MCPHMNGGSVFPYNKRSLCRKPDYGMLVIAEQKMLEEHSVMIDWPFSILVGDREEDKLCANNANITFCDAKLFRRWEVGFVPTKFNVNLPVALPGEGSFYDRLEQVDDNLEKEK